MNDNKGKNRITMAIKVTILAVMCATMLTTCASAERGYYIVSESK